MTISDLTQFFGWMTVINVVFLSFTTLSLILSRRFLVRFHSRLFGMDERDLSRAYFQYLSNYKLAVAVLNIAPYLALKLMA